MGKNLSLDLYFLGLSESRNQQKLETP